MGQQLIVQIYTLDAILKSLAEMNSIPLDQVLYLMTLYDASIPDDYKLFIQGISDSTGIPYLEVMFQVTWMDVYYGFLVPMAIQTQIAQIAACTAIGSDNTLGQTYDLGGIMTPTLAYVKYTLLDRSPVTVFSIWQGAFTYPMGKNNRDVMIVGNLIQNIFPGDFGTPLSIKTMIALETSRTTEQCLEIMLSSFPGGYNYIISDRRGNGVAVQTIQVNPYFPENVDIEEIETVEVRTNTYLRPDFFSLLVDPTYAIERQAKAEELAMAEYDDNGKLSTNEIIEIMQYYDGTEATINRPPNPYNPLDTGTLGFISMNKHYVKFGLGMVSDDYGIVWM
ncbi:MAG: hypothetical protein KGD63_05350 [Candidatus Lokiarchaeota archaeon]|nr:hypothetical protein [Candidatus Lokiarchaeota archaeon]